MRPLLARSIALALSLLALSACADPSAPVQKAAEQVAVPSFAVGGPSATNYVATGKVLHRTKWENYDVTTSAYITPDRGGSLEIRSLGLKVVFPKGSVSATTLVSVTAYAGNKVVYEFAPHGTQFLVPIMIQQDLKNTRAYGDSPLAHDLFGGYTPLGLSDVGSDGTVSVSETFTVELVPDTQKQTRWAKFYTSHFSGYVLASARSAY